MKYFGTDGIRGIADDFITEEFAFKIARAGAIVLTKHVKNGSKPKILIGRDTRISGSKIEKAMTKGFLSFGAQVESAGVIPTPGIAYLTKKYNLDMGVVISASHNSYEYNGIKFFSNEGIKIPDEIEEEIEEYIDCEYSVENINYNNDNLILRKDYVESYVKFIIDIFKDDFSKLNKRDFIVGIDTANGATYEVAEKIFKELGIRYKILFNNPDGININKECGSTHVENLEKAVIKEKLSIGIAYDGDGDRCITVNEEGKEVNGDIILALIAEYLKKNNKLEDNKLIATVMSNLGLKKFAQKEGFKFIQTKVGDRYILEEMLKNGGNFGGEQSGHIIIADYNLTGDGIATSLLIIKILLNSIKKFSEICKIITIYPQVLVNVRVKKFDINEFPEIKQKISQVEKELAEDGRVLIRKSGTEPLIRIMLEGKDEGFIKKAANEIAEIIKKKMS